jgi:hypothetical protein
VCVLVCACEWECVYTVYQRGCGIATTQAICTPGSAASAFSRSTELIHSPPLLIKSFERSRMIR